MRALQLMQYTYELGMTCDIFNAKSSNTAPIFVKVIDLLCIGKYTKSMSTERRGISCTKKLIAVPPLRAKSFWAIYYWKYW